jgi:hypothetical protein
MVLFYEESRWQIISIYFDKPQPPKQADDSIYWTRPG